MRYGTALGACTHGSHVAHIHRAFLLQTPRTILLFLQGHELLKCDFEGEGPTEGSSERQSFPVQQIGGFVATARTAKMHGLKRRRDSRNAAGSRKARLFRLRSLTRSAQQIGLCVLVGRKHSSFHLVSSYAIHCIRQVHELLLEVLPFHLCWALAVPTFGSGRQLAILLTRQTIDDTATTLHCLASPARSSRDGLSVPDELKAVMRSLIFAQPLKSASQHPNDLTLAQW